MAKEKQGYSVNLSLSCTDDKGVLISDIPTGGWYGLTRQQANTLAMALNDACTAVVDGFNKMEFGDDYRNPQPPPSRTVPK